MTKKIAICFVLAAIFFSGCTAPNDQESKNSTNQETEQQGANRNESPQEYRIAQSDNFSSIDFETVFDMSKDFFTDYYKAIKSGQNLNLDIYMDNASLKEYTDLKIAKGKTDSDSYNVDEGLTLGINNIEWQLEKNYVYLSLTAKLENNQGGGFAEGQQILIENKKGRLFIVDLHSNGVGNPSFLDDIARGYVDKINDVDIWENEEWANKIIEKAKESNNS